VAEQGERTIDSALQLVGQKNILWGSDYPHVDALDVATHVPTEQEQLGLNAEAVFNF
jgi:predicted TIM-barrel fold metal-dependent hydrolase